MIGFGEFGRKRDDEIVSIDDKRLICINPTAEKDFFDFVIGFNTASNKNNDFIDADKAKKIHDFIDAVKEVKEANIPPFWKPIYDPSLQGEKVGFIADKIPAVGHSFQFWEAKAKELPSVDEYYWQVGTEYQYYAFLVWIINNLVKKKEWRIVDALHEVVINTKIFGHYFNKQFNKELERTGSGKNFGVCDLTNTTKLLACTNQEIGGFWIAGGDDHGKNVLALLKHEDESYDDLRYDSGVGWLVLCKK